MSAFLGLAFKNYDYYAADLAARKTTRSDGILRRNFTLICQISRPLRQIAEQVYSAYPYASPFRGLREKLFQTIFSAPTGAVNCRSGNLFRDFAR